MGEILFVEEDILTESAEINGMTVAFIKVRVDNFWQFGEDGSRRRCWSPVRSVATSESLADILF